MAGFKEVLPAEIKHLEYRRFRSDVPETGGAGFSSPPDHLSIRYISSIITGKYSKTMRYTFTR